MKELNMRKKKFYSSAIRSFVVLLVLILLIAVAPQINILQNQEILKIGKELKTGADIAIVIIALIIVGVLINFAYISESQLPKVAIKIPQIGLIISSVIHIAVIFIAYFYLLPYATTKSAFATKGSVNQIFNAVFLILLCVPLFRGGKALYDGISSFTFHVTEETFKNDELHAIKCDECGANNDPTAKFCQECGSKLSIGVTSQYIVCKNCNMQNEASAKHCTECGNKLQEASPKIQTNTCPQCGTENKPGVKHCSECGTDLTKTGANAG